MVRSARGAGGWERRRRSASTVIDLADRVRLPVGPDEAWARMADVELVASCIPGIVPGSIEQTGEHAFAGRLVKTAVGVTATWNLRAELFPSEAARCLRVTLEGEEPRLALHLGGWAELEIGTADAGEADLDYRGHIEVTGRLAATGGPVIRGTVDGIVRRFVAAVAQVETPKGPLGRAIDRLLAVLRRLLGRTGR